MADKRVIEQTASSELYNDDWFLKDSVLQGTTKISVGNLKELLTGDVNDRVDKLLRNIIGPTYEWSASKTYKAGAIVYYEDSLYYCIVDTATVGTFVSSEWRYVDLYENLTGKIQSVIKMLAPYMQFSDISTIMPYSKGDIVRYQPTGTYKEKFYVAKEDLPEGIESYDPNDWDEYDTLGELIAGVIAEISDNLTADGISYDNTTSGLEADDVQEAIDEVVTDIESVETALETKAEVDGFYDELYAGNLLSDNTETDNAPYLYRQSPSGKSCVDLSLVGGTVAWNQLVDKTQISATQTINQVTFTNNGNGTITASGTASALARFDVTPALPIISGHKYLLKGCPYGGASEPYLMALHGSSADVYDKGFGLIWSADVTNKYISIYVGNGVSLSTGVTFIPQFYDLTQMFGSTIADYIYTLEQATAGSGIAWLKSYGYLTKDYYAYSSGKLESVNVSSRKVVGFNQWDEEWEVGAYNINDGAKANSGTQIRSKNYINVFPNVSYYWMIPHSSAISGFAVALYYDENKNYISCQNMLSNGDTLVMPSNCRYVTFFLSSLYGTTYNHNICINISDTSKNGTYEPYTSTTYSFDSSKILRGIPKLSNGQMYYDGDVMTSDGSVKRKYGVVNLGDLTWNYSNERFNALVDDSVDFVSSTTTDINMMCKKYPNITSAEWYNKTKVGIGHSAQGYSSAKNILVYDPAYTDAQAFKTAMNGVYLVYELATPTTESAQPFTNPQIVGSTEEFIDAGTSASTPTRDVAIPVGQDSKYHTDLKAKLEELAKIPDVPSSNGTYTLKATRSASGVSYSWVSG